MSFTFQSLEIPDVVVVRPTAHTDARGSFVETYRRSAFVAGGIDAVFVQDNVVRSGAGALRGLHFQRPPGAQGKLLRVLRGSIFDVAVDLRAGSPWYGQWLGREMTAESGDMLWIPPGFAHGYAVLGEGADVAYKVTAEHDPSLDAGVRWDDVELAVRWPYADPIVSARDRALPSLADSEAAE